MSFKRWPRFLGAVCRRMLFLMVALRFDDANVVDVQAALGSGQALLLDCFQPFGTPFAEAKKQVMAHQTDFLGLIHDLSAAITQGVIVMGPMGKSRRTQSS